jgi:hypothetical protein
MRSGLILGIQAQNLNSESSHRRSSSWRSQLRLLAVRKLQRFAPHVEMSPSNCCSESQIILHTRHSTPCTELVEEAARPHFNDELGNEPQAEWRGQIEQHLFRGAPPLNEVVFFHPATRTLILTDLVFNTPKGAAKRSPLFYWLWDVGHFGPHRFVRLRGIREIGRQREARSREF